MCPRALIVKMELRCGIYRQTHNDKVTVEELSLKLGKLDAAARLLLMQLMLTSH